MKISQDLLYMPCPCDSGKKFKFCCLEKVRNQLPFEPDKADITMAVRKAKDVYGMVNGVDPFEDRKAVQTMFKAMDLRREGNMQEALDLFIEARTQKPSLYTAWNNEAQMIWEAGDLENAINAQEKGLSYSADCNAYGWAQLAIFHYYLTQNEAYEECLNKALAISPISADAAARVCSALALQKRHHDIIAYAKKSGFDESEQVAYYLTLALLNIGDKQAADEYFEVLSRGRNVAKTKFVALLLALINSNNEGDILDRTPNQKIPYFFTYSPDVETLLGHVFAYPRPAYENLACDILESVLQKRLISKDDALEALSYFKGERVNSLRSFISSTPDYTMPKSYKPGTIGGELAIQRVLEETEHVLPACLSLGKPPFFETIEDEEVHQQIHSSLATLTTARKGTKTIKAALDSLAAFCEKYPDNTHLKAQYARELSCNKRAEEAFTLLQEILEADPNQFFARATMIAVATQVKQLEVAKRYIDTTEIPPRMHILAYLQWQTALIDYYKATGKKDYQKVAQKRKRNAINFVQTIFDDMLNTDFDDDDDFDDFDLEDFNID